MRFDAPRRRASSTIRVCGESACDEVAALAARIVRDVSAGVDAILRTSPANEHHSHRTLEPETFVALFDAAAALVAADVSANPWDATVYSLVSRGVASEHFDVSRAALQLQASAWSSRRVGDALARIAARKDAPVEPIDAMDAALEAWAEQLAAQAATRAEDGRMTEPMANATWAAGRAARERGAEGWLARARPRAGRHERADRRGGHLGGGYSRVRERRGDERPAARAPEARRTPRRVRTRVQRGRTGVGDCRDDVAGGGVDRLRT